MQSSLIISDIKLVILKSLYKRIAADESGYFANKKLKE